MNLLQCEICQITRSFLNTEVAYNYAVDNTTIMSHKNLHSDELIENVHYFYDYEQTKGGTKSSQMDFRRCLYAWLFYQKP